LKPMHSKRPGIRLDVAPFAGAWIETIRVLTDDKNEVSRPSRARGLKHINVKLPTYVPPVAPFAGAWIETPENV